ncbi:twitching motility protein PilT [Alicyclobacillus hesperidum subsp. aegles]|uniref:type IV pilus twitching motility protein PilT n=1 Tax=Alicyclobacillus hesperidum TaxID=89784 RepID=UPI002229594D|nr:type IV pilus twitching motility protein PilT [Alicyclobacillus hesperidum]GLG02070.1 twitching motility protein PilT [Alicyclobacillus hesperidum subsp. aegles]
MNIDTFLVQAKEKNASDVHLSVNAPVMYRINGELEPAGEPLSPDDLDAMARSMMNAEQWGRFLERGEIDFSYSIRGVSRYRVNAYRQRGCISVAARLIPARIPTLDELGLPKVFRTFMEKPHGLVLVTGPTGSGKSTSLAALLDAINQTQRRHIITLEDPIEYLHTHKMSIVDQREIGLDTLGFAPALRAALRQDPDILLVGEMRDLETISTAITASETGHLVFATLHTSDAVQTVERIIDVFPAEQQGQIRLQIASVLQGVISQRLHRSADGTYRVASFEVLVNTPAVANLIRTGKTHQIPSLMQTGKQFGMQTMEMSMQELVQQGKIAASVLKQWTSSTQLAGW